MTAYPDPFPVDPHAQGVAELAAQLAVEPAAGLMPAEAVRRRHLHGANVIRRQPPRSLAAILLDQFRSLITALLGGAAVLAAGFGHWTEAAAIAVVIAVNAAIGFATEWRAVRSMEGLRGLIVRLARVRRDGRVAEVPAADLVPGDVVLVEGGDIVAADLRLVEASRLECDESVLTGESLPVAKSVEAVPATTPIAERSGMAFQGTAVTRGSGAGIVVATGMRSELGRIAALIEQAGPERTPLERRIAALSRQLVWLTLGLAAAIAGSGIAAGKPVLLMLETAIALAVAAVPEGLPMVTTLVLARGMWRMARRNALIERLSAVETLGATTVILTDKTGTLTENRMAATRLHLPGGEHGLEGDVAPELFDEGSAGRRALEIAVLCNNASLGPAGGADGASGDPTELALLRLAARFGVERPAVLGRWPEVREDAFDSDRKMMATVHGCDGRYLVAVKGAPEAVLAASVAAVDPDGDRPLSDADRAVWHARAEALAAAGLRVLALASRAVASPAEPAYAGLTLAGLVGLQDPPRRDVADAIAACRQAGIRVVMVTGDHLATAGRIAEAVGLSDADSLPALGGAALAPLDGLPEHERTDLMRRAVFARVTPAQKLDLIRLYQEAGEIVAMTGDGVNDAPALRRADIGVAMGQRGSQVAREAADMVLRDDAFASIAAAVAQGRVIFANIRKFLVYLLSCNLSEIMVVGLAALADMPLPLLPLQILYLNLVTDVFPAFALGAGEGERDVMKRPPRPPREPILARRQWFAIGGYAAALTAATLSAFALARWWLAMPTGDAVTVSFVTLALGQLWHVFNMRDRGSRVLVNDITRNGHVWAALGLCAGLVVVAVYFPPLAGILALTPPPPPALALAVGLSLMPLAVGQVLKGRGRPQPAR